MELESLLEYLLPKEIFHYFNIKKTLKDSDNILLLYLDEKPIIPFIIRNAIFVKNKYELNIYRHFLHPEFRGTILDLKASHYMRHFKEELA